MNASHQINDVLDYNDNVCVHGLLLLSVAGQNNDDNDDAKDDDDDDDDVCRTVATTTTLSLIENAKTRAYING